MVCTLMVGGFAGSGRFRDDGHIDMGSWLAQHTNAREAEGLVRREQLHLLTLLPLFGEALVSGFVGVAQLRLLTKAVTQEREHLAVRDEAVLTKWAKELPVQMFGQVVARWVGLCDDELNDPESGDERLQAKRSVQLHVLPDGTWRLSGVLDPVGGETVRAAIEAAMPKPCEGDTRTLPQRRHDALVDACAESLRNADRAFVGGERPNVTIHVEAATGLSSTPQLFYLSGVTQDMVMCDANVTTVWLDTTGQPFDVETPTSDIPLRNRKAVVARDRCCRYPGCGRPSRWTEIHHIKHREHGGTHEIGNLVTLCRFHHRQVHKQRLKLFWQSETNTLTIEWPNGVTINSPPLPTATARSTLKTRPGRFNPAQTCAGLEAWWRGRSKRELLWVIGESMGLFPPNSDI